MISNKYFGDKFNNKYFGAMFNNKYSTLKLRLSPHSIHTHHINLTTNSQHLPTQNQLPVLSNESTLCSL